MLAKISLRLSSFALSRWLFLPLLSHFIFLLCPQMNIQSFKLTFPCLHSGFWSRVNFSSVKLVSFYLLYVLWSCYTFVFVFFSTRVLCMCVYIFVCVRLHICVCVCMCVYRRLKLKSKKPLSSKRFPRQPNPDMSQLPWPPLSPHLLSRR